MLSLVAGARRGPWDEGRLIYIYIYIYIYMYVHKWFIFV